MGDVVGQLDIALTANTEAFAAEFKAAAEATSKAKNDITLNLRAIKLAAADLNAELAAGALSHSDEITARRNILSLAKQSLEMTKQDGIEHRGNLSALKAFTGEIEKQNAALDGQKGRLSTITAQILNAVKLRAAGLPGLGGLGGNLAIRAYEPVGKIAEEGAGKLEAMFGSAALAVGGTVAAIAAVGLIAGEVTHKMMDLAQSIENTAAATGLSTTQVQEFNELAREMGVDAGTLEMEFARLQSQMGEFTTGSGNNFKRSMKELGVSLYDADNNARPLVAILGDFSDKLNKIADPAERTKLELGALGSRGRALVAIFEQARREGISLGEALKSIDASGAVLTPAELDRLMVLKEQWDSITLAIKGAGIRLGMFVAEGVGGLSSVAGAAEGLLAKLDKIAEKKFPGITNVLKQNAIATALGPAGDLLAIGKSLFEKQHAAEETETAKHKFISDDDITKAQDLNEQLTKRLAMLKAGGELQLELNQAEEQFTAALHTREDALRKGDADLAKNAREAEDLYRGQIISLQQIIALEHQKADLSKLQNEYAATEQEYTVAALNGDKALMQAKASQLKQYDTEIEKLEKIKGIIASTAFEKLKVPAPANLGPRVVPDYLEVTGERREGKRGREGDFFGAKSGLAPAEYYREAGGNPLAPPNIDEASMKAGAPDMADLSGLIGASTTEQIAQANETMQDLRRKFRDSIEEAMRQGQPVSGANKQFAASFDVDELRQQYQKDLENFQLMFEMKKITAQQFAEAETELETMANRQLQSVWEERVAQFGSAAERMRAFEGQIADEGKNYMGKVFDSMHSFVDGLEDSITRLVTTGKGGFRQLFESFTQEMIKADIQLGFSKIAGSFEKHSKTHPPTVGGPADMGPDNQTGWAATLRKMFGGGAAEHGKTGGTKANPFYVVPVGAGFPSPSDLKNGANAAPGAGWVNPFENRISREMMSAPGAPANASGATDWMKALGIGGETNIPNPAAPDWMSALGIGAPTNVPPPAGASAGASALGGITSLFSSFLGSKNSGQGGDNSGGLLGMFSGMFGGGAGKGSTNGPLGMFSSLFASSSSESTGFLSMIPEFAGFLAEGGDVTPGKAYVVGEKHPEIFFPGKSGRVEPFIHSAPPSRPNVTANVIVNGVENADSFRRSSSQIAAHLHATVSHAAMKNK